MTLCANRIINYFPKVEEETNCFTFFRRGAVPGEKELLIFSKSLLGRLGAEQELRRARGRARER